MTLESIIANHHVSPMYDVPDDYELPQPTHHEWVLMDDDTWELVPCYS